MSHFVIAVVLPKGTDAEFDDLEGVLEPIMRPFNENQECALREVKCGCAKWRERTLAADAAAKECGTLDSIRDAFGARPDIVELRGVCYSQDTNITDEQRAEAQELLDKEWRVALAPFNAAEQRYKDENVAKLDIPDADCSYCKGSGIDTTTRPPDAFDKAGALIGGAKWDWYVVGGRWTGFLTDYNPATDPRNIETCYLCHGSGTRTDMKVNNGCNGCNGAGKSVKFSYAPYEGDLGTVAQMLDGGDKRIPFAILLPDGRWIERGEMGWWGCVSNEQGRDEWVNQVRTLLEPLRDRQVVVVDCHI